VETAANVLQSVQIYQLRGIQGPLSVELVATGVTLIYGENGSGKTSICDALEFGLRGVISRRLTDGRKERRELRNLAGPGAPTVDITMRDGRTFRRGYARPPWDPSGLLTPLDRDSAVPGFEVAPVVLRRRVVEVFWEIPASARLDLFWDYLRPPGVEWRTPDDRAVLAEHERAEGELSKARRALGKIVPKGTVLLPDGRPWIPPNRSAALRSIRRAIQTANVARGNPSRWTEEQETVANRYGDALKAEEALRAGAEVARRRVERDPSRLGTLLLAAGERAGADYRAVLEPDWLSDVRVGLTDDALSVELIRQSGRPLDPTEILSEAQLDLLALFILIEIHIECTGEGNAEFLVLDDVFQSVDAPLRQRALDHIASRLNGWQLVLTIHDRLWLEIASRCFSDAGIERRAIELRAGGYGGTPRVIGGHIGPLRDLDGLLEAGLSGPVVAGAAGRAMEHLADELSKSLRVSVVRKEREDYNIGDLWPPIRNLLRRSSFWDDQMERLERAQFLRNKLGSHYAPWGDGISDSEVAEAARLVRHAWELLACDQCGKVVRVERAGGQIVRGCTHGS
jgi:AAA domain